MGLLLPIVYQVDPYFLNSVDMCSTNDIAKTGIYIFQKSIKKKKFFLCKGLVIVLVFTEEIAFKHFLFINITNYFLTLILQSPGSLYSLVIT